MRQNPPAFHYFAPKVLTSRSKTRTTRRNPQAKADKTRLTLLGPFFNDHLKVPAASKTRNLPQQPNRIIHHALRFKVQGVLRLHKRETEMRQGTTHLRPLQ